MRIISYQDGIVLNNVQKYVQGFLPSKVLIGLIKVSTYKEKF